MFMDGLIINNISRCRCLFMFRYSRYRKHHGKGILKIYLISNANIMLLIMCGEGCTGNGNIIVKQAGYW